MGHSPHHFLLEGRLDLSGPLGARCRLRGAGDEVALQVTSLAALWRLGRAMSRSAGPLGKVLRSADIALHAAGLKCRVDVNGAEVARLGRGARPGLLSRLLGLEALGLRPVGLLRALLPVRSRD